MFVTVQLLLVKSINHPVQLVNHNVLLVKIPSNTVPIVLVLELLLQPVHVHTILSHKLITLVNNVSTNVEIVLKLLITVPLVQMDLTDLLHLVIVITVIMMLV